jgi:hypothetical protein
MGLAWFELRSMATEDLHRLRVEVAERTMYFKAVDPTSRLACWHVRRLRHIDREIARRGAVSSKPETSH